MSIVQNACARFLSFAKVLTPRVFLRARARARPLKEREPVARGLALLTALFALSVAAHERGTLMAICARHAVGVCRCRELQARGGGGGGGGGRHGGRIDGRWCAGGLHDAGNVAQKYRAQT